VLDVSISIGSRNDPTVGNERFKVVTDFVSRLADFSTIGPNDTLIGVILFAQTAVLRFNVTAHTNKNDLKNTINSIVYSNIKHPNHTGTNTPDALKLLREAGQRDGALKLRRDNKDILKIAVVITDGVANNKPLDRGRKVSAVDTKKEADALKAANIYDYIFAVGIEGKDRQRLNENQLRQIATGNHLVFRLNDFDKKEFIKLQQDITNTVCESK